MLIKKRIQDYIENSFTLISALILVFGYAKAFNIVLTALEKILVCMPDLFSKNKFDELVITEKIILKKTE